MSLAYQQGSFYYQFSTDRSCPEEQRDEVESGVFEALNGNSKLPPAKFFSLFSLRSLLIQQ